MSFWQVLLSKERLNLDATDGEDGNTVLHVAAKKGNCSMVVLLLLHGAHVCLTPSHPYILLTQNPASFDVMCHDCLAGQCAGW